MCVERERVLKSKLINFVVFFLPHDISDNIFSLVFVFSFSDNGFKEKLIRNVKKEVGLVIRKRFANSDTCKLFVTACYRQRSGDPVTFLHFSFFL